MVNPKFTPCVTALIRFRDAPPGMEDEQYMWEYACGIADIYKRCSVVVDEILRRHDLFDAQRPRFAPLLEEAHRRGLSERWIIMHLGKITEHHATE